VEGNIKDGKKISKRGERFKPLDHAQGFALGKVGV
jgi:hypothetical protein